IVHSPGSAHDTLTLELLADGRSHDRSHTAVHPLRITATGKAPNSSRINHSNLLFAGTSPPATTIPRGAVPARVVSRIRGAKSRRPRTARDAASSTGYRAG